MPDDWTEVDAPPPPSRPAKSGRLADFVQSRQERPGAWAQYRPGHGHTPTAGHAMKRAYPGLETTTRKRPDGKHDVYARWVGDKTELPTDLAQ